MVMSERSVNLTTLFLGRPRPLKWLTSTKCTYFRQKLTTALRESAEEEKKVYCRTGYQTRDLWLLCHTRYRLRNAKLRFVWWPNQNHPFLARLYEVKECLCYTTGVRVRVRARGLLGSVFALRSISQQMQWLG